MCLYFSNVASGRYAARVKMITNDAAKASESKEIQRLKVRCCSAFAIDMCHVDFLGLFAMPLMVSALYFAAAEVTVHTGHHRQAEGGAGC